MSQGLFRQEVIDAKRGDWLGSIILAAPLSRWLLTAMAMFVAIALLLFLFLGHYTRRETVSGQLVPEAGLLNVAAPSAGTITRLQVRDGQGVKAGDGVLRLSAEQDSAALGDTHALVGKQLEIQRSRLQSDLLNQRQLAQQQAGALRTRIALLRAQVPQITGQLAIQQRQTSSHKEMLEENTSS